MATACSGFLDERGGIGDCGEPAAATTSPSGSTATAVPWCTLSTKPDRTTRASTAWLMGGGPPAAEPQTPSDLVIGEPLGRSASGDADLAGLVPARDLLGEQVDDRLHLAPRAAHPRIDVGERGDLLGELDVAHGGEVGATDVRDRPLGLAPVLADAAGRGAGDVAAEAAGLPLLVGQDPRERGDDLDVRARLVAEGTVAAARGLLGAQDVEAALQQPARVGEVDLLLVGVGPADAQLLEVDALDVLDEGGGENAVDPAAATGKELRHGDRLLGPLAMCSQVVTLRSVGSPRTVRAAASAATPAAQLPDRRSHVGEVHRRRDHGDDAQQVERPEDAGTAERERDEAQGGRHGEDDDPQRLRELARRHEGAGLLHERVDER